MTEEVANIGVGVESKLGTGGGAASFVDVRGGWREVLACGEEACSREEELWAEVANTVVGDESKVVTGGVAFVCGIRREGSACGEEVCSREG